MKSYKDNYFLEDVCTWDFKILENKLKSKLQYLAIIEAYPYKIKGELYYKYTNLKIYKLKDFLDFLRLIETDKIRIDFYIREKTSDDGKVIIDNHGMAFRIKSHDIDKLFSRIS